MEHKSCFFIGHRDAPESLLPVLEGAVERHILEYGVTSFVVGYYGRFDALAARAVRAAKKRHPSVTLTLLLPYHPAERPVDIPPGIDDTWYPLDLDGVPRRFAIVRANRRAAEDCTHMIAYVRHTMGNARDVMSYAQRKGRAVTNLAEEEKEREA